MCGEIKIIAKIDKNNNSICYDCYEKKCRIKENCVSCNKLRKIEERDENNNPTCKICYKKKKRKEDAEYAVICRLRSRLHNAFIKYSNTGKIMKSSDYGIDYQMIFEYLGSCPGARKDYHIDHVFPLSAFDLNNPTHIRASFAPENHQWLKKEKNLSKSNKYNVEEFEKYLNKFL